MDSQGQTVILGAGFVGLLTALHLSHEQHNVLTILIDQEERFTFKPLLYELLSGEMSADQVWPSYRELLDGSDVNFVQDSVTAIDLERRQVELASGSKYAYSHLVLALGSTNAYFGVEGAEENTYSFRNGEDAVAIAKHLHDCLQQASQTKDAEQRRKLLTVAIIGAGPSGVELAATLTDLLPQWYAQLGGNVQEIRVALINRGKEILEGDINSRIRETAQKSLQQRPVPVELIMGAEVAAVHPNQVEFKRNNQPEAIEAATTVWTAGTATHPLIKHLPVPEEHRDKHGRLQVTPTLQLPDFPEVFVAGDCAVSMQLTDDKGHEPGYEQDEAKNEKRQEHNLKPLPSTAQVAYQQGAAIAHNLKAIAAGKSPKPSKVNLRGSLLKLGLNDSAANIFDRFEITGQIGHLIRQATYLELLPTPVHNFKATTEWLTDEVFQRYDGDPEKRTVRVWPWLGSIAAVCVLALTGLAVWREAQPQQFNQALRPTGLPGLLDRATRQGQ